MPICRFFFRGECRNGSNCRFEHTRERSPPEGIKGIVKYFQPGDWMCPECKCHNFARRDQCFDCGVTRSGDGGGGGRRRSKSRGRSKNRSRRSRSRTRSRRRSRGSISPGRRSKVNSSGAWIGDWYCGDCGCNNFARRQRCYRCDKARDRDDLVAYPGEKAFPGSKGNLDRGGKPVFNPKYAHLEREGWGRDGYRPLSHSRSRSPLKDSLSRSRSRRSISSLTPDAKKSLSPRSPSPEKKPADAGKDME